MRTILVIVALCAAVAVAQMPPSPASDVVTVTNCQDGSCTKGCQNQTFQQNQCLRVENKNDFSVELSCYNGPSLCAQAMVYNDAKCTQLQTLRTHVCSSCQFNYTLNCGALPGALFWAYNCTDTACNDCAGADIVTFNKCTHIPLVGYVIVKKVFNCKAVTLKNFQDASCSGTPFEYQYPSGDCVGGSTMTCHPPSGEQLGSSVKLQRKP